MRRDEYMSALRVAGILGITGACCCYASLALVSSVLAIASNSSLAPSARLDKSLSAITRPMAVATSACATLKDVKVLAMNKYESYASAMFNNRCAIAGET